MKVSRATIKQLSAFRSLGSVIILTPSSRFFIFGKGIDRKHCSLTVEGDIQENVDGYGIFEIPQPKDTSLTVAPKQKYDPKKKIHFFDELLSNTEEIASFFIDEIALKSIKETDKNKTLTHIRFWRSDGNIFTKSFDARRYYVELIGHKRGKHKLISLSDPAGGSFVTYAVYQTFKLLEPDSYDVSIFSNGMMIFSGIELGTTYYLRDQRLGNDWAEELDNSIVKENVLLFDPRRVAPIRRKIQPPS